MTDADNAQRMPLYQGTKQLYATPMSRGDYNAYRGWTVPADEDPTDAGYLVEYKDGGKPNDDRHAGYISWSPADVFEKAYKPCDTHIERMQIELDELNARHEKLDAFTETATYKALPELERALLYTQFQIMGSYSCILETRLRLAKSLCNG